MAIGNLLSTQEAADIIGCTRVRVIQMLNAGEMHGKKINDRAWVIEKAEAERIADREYTTGRPRTRQK